MSTAPASDLKPALEKTAWAFRGYNVTNLGKTTELMKVPQYTTIVTEVLETVSQLASAILRKKIDYVSQVEEERETTLETYPEATGLILGIELAQLRILEEQFEIPYESALLATGYSLGEVTALVKSGVFQLEDAMKTVMNLAQDAGSLATEVTMGILFSRSPEIDFNLVNRRCMEITAEGQGTIAISSYLSPNTLLLLGQHQTIDRFKETIEDHFTDRIHLKKNPDQWPPIHTPIVWQKNLTDRAGLLLSSVSTSYETPSPKLISCVTGKADYTTENAREMMRMWVDHPQQLWDVIESILDEGVERIIHIGPEPNIIPATLTRLSNNVQTQLNQRSFAGMGLRAVSRIVRHRSWLSQLLSADATLLRAPFVENIILEDWLLEQHPGT